MMRLGSAATGFLITWLRYLLVVGLGLGLLLLGYYAPPLQDWLTTQWQRILSGLSGRSGGLGALLQTPLPSAMARRPLPVLLVYLSSYLVVALLLLRLLLPQPAAWRLAWRCYAGLLGIYGALLLLAWLGGRQLPWAFPLARLVVELLGTPIPVAVLFILLRYGGAAARP